MLIVESCVLNRSMVVKRFKTPLGKDVRGVHKRERYWAQMEVQSVSAHMANEFNKWYVFGVSCFCELSFFNTRVGFVPFFLFLLQFTDRHLRMSVFLQYVKYEERQKG